MSISRETVGGRVYLDLQRRAKSTSRNTQELIQLYILDPDGPPVKSANRDHSGLSVFAGPVRSQSAAAQSQASVHQRSQRARAWISRTTNTTRSFKRPGVMVRDEEVVGSNPATPTVFMQVDGAPPVFRSEPSLAPVRSRCEPLAARASSMRSARSPSRYASNFSVPELPGGPADAPGWRSPI
jgi:hypothetical protein